MAVVHGTAGDVLDAALPTFLRVGAERTFPQDRILALRVLADIALRGLSTAIDYPTTAVQVRWRVGRLLSDLTSIAPPERLSSLRTRVDALDATDPAPSEPNQ